MAYEEDHIESITERVETLRKEALASAFALVDKIKKKQKRFPEEEERQVELMQQLKVIETIYNSILRSNKLAGKSNNDEKFDRAVNDKIKEMQSSVGDINRSTQ